ncbi:MAG TPA: hypothetical protein PLG09_09965 [Syntrophomonadaceae bacterium]|nr:hypothetical protein [Syntrophomonadaceae bacterium]HOQ10436.1 hypothetical protein [Syntrophomonadaceae bacterium]HPU49587.1 hypothetical protein [Syntrophomonadaceae bacterium]
MENNLVSLNRVFLNITSPGDKRGLVFNQGDILRGVVRDVDINGMVRVLIQGQLIEAMSEVKVNSGQDLNLLVEEVRPGRITLKVLTPEVMNRLEQANLAAQLKELGFKASEENIRLARNLLENHLPVNRSTMGQAAQILQHLGGSAPENCRLAALAIRYGIPASPDVLERLMNFFNSKPDISALYQQISRILARYPYLQEPALKVTGALPEANLPANQSELQTGSSPPAAEPSAFSRISSQVSADQSLLKGPTGAGINQPEIPASIVANRVSPGAIAANYQPAAGEIANHDYGGPSGLPAANALVVGKLWPLIQALLGNMTVEGEATAKPVQTQLQQILLSRPDILQGWLLTETILEINLPENHALRELAGLIKNLEHELSGQQIVNTIGRFSPDTSFPGIYLTFPLQIDQNQYAMCELRLRRDHRQASRQKDSLQIAVSLDTPHMGIVVFHVVWRKSGILDIQGVVEKETVRTFLQNHWSELRAGLEKLGYQVNNLGIRVAGVRTEAESLRPTWPSVAGANIRPISIDITI